MAAAQSPRTETRPFDHAMPSNRFGRILGTRRQEPARSTRKWTQQKLIHPNEAHGSPLHQAKLGPRRHDFDASKHRLRTTRKSRRRLDGEASRSVAFGMTTRSTEGKGAESVRKVSRMSRLARFLTTAPPSFLEATIPSRVHGAPSGATMSVKYRPWALRPVSKTR